MTRQFDGIIVGAGPAGPVPAGRPTEAGQTVVVVERKLIGGTCVNTGCIPTKTLVASAHAAHLARRGAEYGVGTASVASGSAVFGVFNGGDATDIVYDADTRLPLPASVFARGPHARSQASPSRGTRPGRGDGMGQHLQHVRRDHPVRWLQVLGVRPRRRTEVMENYTQSKSVWIDLS